MSLFKFENVIRKLRTVFKIFLSFGLVVYMIVVFEERSLHRRTNYQRLNQSVEDKNMFLQTVCRALITGGGKVGGGDERPWATIPAAAYVNLAADCRCFRAKMGYDVTSSTPEEKDFPIAFSILMYDNLEQTERLLRVIYRPQNVYCIHVDGKSPTTVHLGAAAIAACFENVFVARPAVNVSWGQISVVDAELLCMRKLLASDKSWKYFVNLVGRDFPLRSNGELVKILKSFNGSNYIAGVILDGYVTCYREGRVV